MYGISNAVSSYEDIRFWVEIVCLCRSNLIRLPKFLGLLTWNKQDVKLMHKPLIQRKCHKEKRKKSNKKKSEET